MVKPTSIKSAVSKFSVFRDYLRPFRAIRGWRNRQYSDNAPRFIKEAVLRKHCVLGAQWVETGTYLGKTTEFLMGFSPEVFTIEPESRLYESAAKRFKNSNVEVLNGVSEEIFPELLPQLGGDINFWLDGHYSAGITYQGAKDCPLEDELDSIETNLSNFGRISILVDDVRCFLPENDGYPDYPSVDYLVDWARGHNFDWRIEHDIFVMRNWR